MEDNNQDYENDDLQTQQDVQDDMQNIANTATNMFPKKNKDKSAGKSLRAAGKALQLTGQIVEKVGTGIRKLGKGIKWLGRKTYEGGKNLWDTGKALCETGIGAILGVPVCIAAAATMGLGKLLEGLGWSLEQIGKVIEFLGAKLQDIAQSMINKANEQIREAGGSAANAVGAAGSAAGALAGKKAGASGDGDNDAPKTGGIPSLSGLVKNNKTKLIIIGIILLFVVFLVVYLILDRNTTIDQGSFVDSDKTNVPYTVSSVIMDNLVVASDGSGGYTYGFEDENGDVVDIDKAIDTALKSLHDNDSDSLNYLGKNDEERKALLKKMILAEITTQYPDLSNSVDLGLSNSDTNTTVTESTTNNAENNVNTSGDSSTKDVNQIVQSMTLEEKIYQMMLCGITLSNGQNYANSLVGGYTLHGGSTNINQSNVNSMGTSAKVRPFISTDDEGGDIETAAEGYPSAKEYGSSQDYDTLYNDEVKKSKELISYGINLNLGPDADVSNSGTYMDRNSRSYSSDSSVASKCVSTVVKARNSVNENGAKLGSSLKHYPGYADNENTHNDVAIDNRSADEINEHIQVFKDGISAGADSVMVSHIKYTNLDSNNPASISSTIISDLRNSFSGVIMTDDLDMGAVSSISDRYKRAIIAGNDMILLDYNSASIAYEQIKSAVDSGEITEERINESVTRILNMKSNLGILDAQPSQSIGGSGSSMQVAGTGIKTISDKFDENNKITGGIKVQRKLESGATVDLKYTSTENFNALLSSGSDEVMNYYTLQKNAKTVGSTNANFSGSNNAEVIWNFLRSKGLSEVCTAAIMGNLMAESGLNTGLEETTSRVDKGYGLAQWTFGRREQINNYASMMNKEVSDIELQLQFLWLEIDPNEDHTYANLQWGGNGYGWGNGQALFQQFISTTNIDEATEMFCWAHERPNKTYAHLDKRKEYAKGFYETYAGKSVSSDDTSENKSTSTSSSFDNFLFIGDSRYEGISSELSSLGNNVSVCAVSSSFPHEWVDVTSNGSGSVQGRTVTLPDSATNISVMLGVNNLSETSQMEQLLNNLHNRYQTATIYVNSVYHLGTSYSGGATNSAIDSFNDAIRNFCNQNSWAQYVDITQGLDDDSGNLKSEYCSDGLHITSQEGKKTLVNNIKSAISGSSLSSVNVSMATSSKPGYSIVVANKTQVTTNVIESYEYISTNYTDIGHNSYTDSSKRWSSPSSGPKSSNTNSTYSSTSVAYQEALKNYTLYFDFLWAILVETENADLVEQWADLVCNNVGENSKVTVTVFSKQEMTSTENSNSRPTNLISNNGSIVIDDKYNLTEKTITTTTTLTSKLVVTFADTWLMKYENNASSYEEYTSKDKEVITEKIDPEAEEANAINILKKYSVTLKTLKKEKDIVDEMLEDNEKVSFMIDVFSYILDVARGKNNDEESLSDILDVAAFNLETFRSTTGSSTTLGEFNGTFLEIAKKCHAYVREQGFSYAGNSVPITENSVRHIDCSSYVSWVLYEYGYTDLAGGQLGCSGGTLVPWCNSNLDLVWQGFTHSVSDITNLQPGDICVFGYSSQQGGSITTHTQIFAGYDTDGKAIWYNCGSDNAISRAEGSEKYNTYNYNGQGFLYAYRVPSK